MPSGRLLVIAILLVTGFAPARAADQPRLPKVADGWSIALVQQAPAIRYPSAITVAPDGTIFLGQDPMNMVGPVNAPVDSVLAIRPDGSTRVYADKLHSVMGLEWVDGTLFVVHAPFLSSFRDTDGDGVAESRTDLVTGLGPKVPGFNGLNDHVASGVRRGMDGLLYISVGDKGIPEAKGTDGKTITMSTGGVIRVRPDGTDLELVSTGERNPLSVALSARDDVFTFGNDDDSHRWPNSLTHHIVGGHYGYPYEFLAAPHRALPIVAGQSAGAGAQGVCSVDDGLPERFRGNLFFCDWGLQTVARYEVAPQGASFRLVRREPIVEQGDLADFRPFSIAPTSDGAGFYLVDWAFNGWLGVDAPTGRLFRLTYTGPDRRVRSPRPQGNDPASWIAGLDHPTLAVRLEFQRRLIQYRVPSPRKGLAGCQPEVTAVGALATHLADRSAPETGRVHAIWALNELAWSESTTARGAIRAAMTDPNAAVRAQAIRAGGVAENQTVFAAALTDPDPTVRREAAIALGRLPSIQPAVQSALYQALKETDPTVAWSIRRAIRRQSAWDGPALAAALADPARRDSALTLADGSYAPEVVKVLSDTLAAATQSNNDPAWRARVVAALGGLYAKVPAWSGHWFGTDPLAGPRPKATEPWDTASMDAVLAGVARSLRDGAATVRRQGIIACMNVGPRATPLLRAMLGPPVAETDPTNLVAVVQYLGEQRDTKAASGVARVLADAGRPAEVRLAALDALGQFNGPVAINARMLVLYDAQSPESLIARALPALGRAKLLPSNDLIGFLDHASPTVRAAALGAFPVEKPLTPAVVESILRLGDDPSAEVRTALAVAAGTHRIKEAIPRLVTWATGDGPTRVEAIHALAAIPDRRGFPAYVAAINDRDPGLRRAGLTALTATRSEVASELTVLAQQGAFAGPSALLVERLLATFHPMTDWRVIGPFPRATGPIFGDARAIDFARTEAGAEGQPLAWQRRPADPKSGVVSLDDLPAPGASQDGATAFAVAEVSSTADRAALLVVDATGPLIVALDDRPLANFAAGAVGETVRVDLKSGANRLLLRTRQGVGPWSIRVELSDPGPGSTLGTAVARTTSIGREGLRAFALKRAGDPKNGAAIFHETSGGVGCVRCHAVGGKPATVPSLGPDLTGLALKYDKAEIIRSVLEPSSRIAVGYTSLSVARQDGTTTTGLPRRETAEAIELVQTDGQVVLIPARSISQQRPSEASVMPEGLVDGLKPVEFADLIAYLMSLKQEPMATP